ncbi:phage-related baseplate assembly protein [Acidovorax delafieldii]|uniref:baseplate assembly protein n=1 Tax=Acidovorax delafieldii TaxID=47920 RepID=UPI00285B9B4D|nr:baseplate J/gp47 family protein [Acidovorax delafieldii]MDR6152191.1 phage-related baseplate assembly protein [Acidovorax delafieldii]
MIDLSTVAPPDVVQPLDFEAVLYDLKTETLTRLPQLADVLELESEPITKLLQVMAYREVLLRQRVNEAARAVMVAYAVGGDLEQIGANYGVVRLPGEADSRLRHRVQQAFNRLAAAGPADAYRQHAMGVSADIRDVQVFSEAPGRVTVTVLAPKMVPAAGADATQAAAGLALFGPAPSGHVHIIQPNDGPLLQAVLHALSAEDVRPLTDAVVVRAPRLVPFAVAAVVEVLPGPDATLVLQRRRAALQTYLASCQTQGTDVTRAGIVAALVEPGVKDVRLAQPTANVNVSQGEIAACVAIDVQADVVHA